MANHIVVLGFRLLPAVFDRAVGPLMKLGGLSRRPLADHAGSVLEPNPKGEAEHGFSGRLGRRTVHTEAISPADAAAAGSAAPAQPKPAQPTPLVGF
jgi:hypothetical protein